MPQLRHSYGPNHPHYVTTSIPQGGTAPASSARSGLSANSSPRSLTREANWAFARDAANRLTIAWCLRVLVVKGFEKARQVLFNNSMTQ